MNNQQEQQEGNKIIAEFMGKAIWFPSANGEKMYNSYRTTKEDCLNLILGSQLLYGLNYEPTLMEMQYHTSWDWLMPVVDKICRMKIGDGKETVDYSYPRTFGMLDNDGDMMVRLNGFFLQKEKTLIEATYKAVIEFINWYNTKKP